MAVALKGKRGRSDSLNFLEEIQKTSQDEIDKIVPLQFNLKTRFTIIPKIFSPAMAFYRAGRDINGYYCEAYLRQTSQTIAQAFGKLPQGFYPIN